VAGRGGFHIGPDAGREPQALLGQAPVVWFHTPGESTWALPHTIRRHGGRAEAVITLLVDVPRAWLHRSRKGLWYSARDIPPDRIRRVLSFAELAGASAA
jgi:hypothetical protein